MLEDYIISTFKNIEINIKKKSYILSSTEIGCHMDALNSILLDNFAETKLGKDKNGKHQLIFDARRSFSASVSFLHLKDASFKVV